MSQSHPISNNFINGLRIDNDKNIQPNTSYRYSMGGRLIFNRSDDSTKTLDQNIEDGATASYCNARGTKVAFNLCDGYQVIGSIDTKKGTVIFSTNGVNSEIGILELNTNIHSSGFAKYLTLYNDRLDPFSQRLRFSKDHYIHGFYVSENENIDRVYFTDGLNQKRVVNLNLFYDENGNTIHSQANPCEGFSQYPKHMSAHAFDERMDLVFPRIKFVSRIQGQLKSGQYQLVVKYSSKTGHSSVWSPVSRPVYVTDQKLDGAVSGIPNAYKSNHHNRTMGASNIMTEEGLRWILDGIDNRWDYIHIGYIYHASSIEFQEAIEFKREEIGYSIMLFVNLTSHSGTSITKAELNQRNETVLSVGATGEQDNRRWDADLEMLPEIKLDLSNVEIKPHFKYFLADQQLEPVFSATPNPVSGRDDNDPITNTIVTTTKEQISNFTGEIDEYDIIDDFRNYKGQQFFSLYKGYFRGETYPFAAVVLDRKGNPLFVQPIKDFTFPEMSSSDDLTLTRNLSGGQYELRAMGAMISGIKIPANAIRDKFGNLNISGIMIVRASRIATIAAQGLIYNTVNTDNRDTSTEQDRYIQPQLWVHNEYSTNQSSSPQPDSFVYQNVLGSGYEQKGERNFWNKVFNNNDNPVSAFSTAYYFNFHSPDILIDRQITDKMREGRIKIEALAHRSTFKEWVSLMPISNHVYTKNYKTVPRTTPAYGTRIKKSRAKIGESSRIALAILHERGVWELYEKFDPERADRYDYRANVWLKEARNENNQLLPHFVNRASISAFQQPGSVILKLLDFAAVDHIEGQYSRTTQTIANWKITPDEYYNKDNETSLETRRYFSTGHYQPITEDILNKFVPSYDSEGKIESYTINDIEVWGGDCYVNLFDFTRLYPEYSDCNTSAFSGFHPDYSVSHIVPIESKYNLALLYGRRFAANAVNPQLASCTNAADHMANGIMVEQPEDWSYNEVLLLEENTKFYFPKPHDIKILNNIETGIAWSPQKIYGEIEDSYRIQMPGDIGFAEGAFGRVQGLRRAFNGLYVVQESGFGFIRTRQRSIIPTNDGDEITIKSGDVFSGIEYISRRYGTQHRNSIWSIDNNIGFIDAKKGKYVVFNQAGLSKESERDNIDDAISKITLYFEKDITHDENFVDIVSGIDEENNEVWTSFIHNRDFDPVGSNTDKIREVGERTIVYNARMGYFVGWMPVSPRIYMNSGRFLLAPNVDLQSEVHLFNYGKYGHWFGKYHDTILRFIVNPQPDTTKVFDNGIIAVNEDGWIRINKIHHESAADSHEIIISQRVGTSIIRPDFRPRWYEDLLRYQMHEEDYTGTKQRLRGKHLVVTIYIDNSRQEIDGKDARVVITSFTTKFRISHNVQF